MKWWILTFIVISFAAAAKPAFADVGPVNPFGSQCPNGLKTYYCTYVTKDYREEISDSCRMYENNPDFINFSYDKEFDHSNSGQSIGVITITNQYCGPTSLGISSLLAIVQDNLFWQEYARRLLVTLGFELVVVLLFRTFRNRKVLLSFLLANILSVLLLHLFVIIVPIASLLLVTVIGEILVVLFEFSVVWFVSKKKWRSVFVPILLANSLSAIVGTIFFFGSPLGIPDGVMQLLM